MQKIDYKKQDKLLYFPPTTPTLIEVPKMNFIAVSGKGNPNDPAGDYQKALNLLYGISFTIKMSKMSGQTPRGYHDYAIPPLEGLWQINLDQITDFSKADKSKFQWTSLIRLPEYVTKEVFNWALQKLKTKKPDLDTTKAKYLILEEGLCAQIMHTGPYDNEPATIQTLKNFIHETGHQENFNKQKNLLHHEIYLSDPRKTAPEKLKTVIRHPIKTL